MERSELLSIIEQAARYGWDHPSWDWPSVNGDLARFLPPPPAEQASEDDMRPLLRFGRHDEDCAYRHDSMDKQRPDCTCGLANALSQPDSDAALAKAFRDKCASLGWRWSVLCPVLKTIYDDANRVAPQQPEKGEG